MAKLHNLATIPPGSIWRGDGVIDFKEERRDTDIIKELLKESDETGKELFVKPGFTTKGRADDIKKVVKK
jgi:hypothetical protein